MHLKTIRKLKAPLIIASIHGQFPLSSQLKNAKKNGADILELRIDTFSKQSTNLWKKSIQNIKKQCALPILLTIRSEKEQGLIQNTNKFSDFEREQIFTTLMPHIHAIDIELSSTLLAKKLIKTARQQKKIVILSYHNFHAIPSVKKIAALKTQFKLLSGDIFKIAATTRSIQETRQLLELCWKLEPIPRCIIAMGKIGAISRIAGFLFGSCLTYGSVSTTTAPGQFSIKTLQEFKKSFYTGY